jgi:hypothetical protein
MRRCHVQVPTGRFVTTGEAAQTNAVAVLEVKDQFVAADRTEPFSNPRLHATRCQWEFALDVGHVSAESGQRFGEHLIDLLLRQHASCIPRRPRPPRVFFGVCGTVTAECRAGRTRPNWAGARFLAARGKIQ